MVVDKRGRSRFTKSQAVKRFGGRIAHYVLTFFAYYMGINLQLRRLKYVF